MALSVNSYNPSARLYSTSAQNQNRLASGAKVTGEVQADSAPAAAPFALRTLGNQSGKAAETTVESAQRGLPVAAGEAAQKQVMKAAENNDQDAVNKLMTAAQDTVNGLLSQRRVNVETDFGSSRASLSDVDIPAELANLQKAQALIDVSSSLFQQNVAQTSKLSDLIKSSLR